MLAPAPIAVFSAISPDRYVPHPLHDGTRDWPETNCYIDVWIEVLNAMNEDASAALGFTVAQDFEGDHFTFQKFPLEDLQEQFGLEVQEVALYDSLEAHIVEQTKRGRLMVFEVDGFHLPDTRGVSYRLEHTKTTIAVNRIDPARRELDYFHNAGFYALGPDDYDAILMKDAPEGALFPYAEFVKLDRRRRLDATTSLKILRKHLARRPEENPGRGVPRARPRAGGDRGPSGRNAFLHKYAFNTARQLGMNFELLSSHLDWLQRMGLGWAKLHPAVESCKALSSGAKAFQFQLARAVARKRFDAIETALDPLVDHYARIFEGLEGV